MTILLILLVAILATIVGLLFIICHYIASASLIKLNYEELKKMNIE